MNNTFYQIAISDPECQDQDFLQAVSNDPELAAVLKQSQQFNQQLLTTLSSVEPSASLSQKLHDICKTAPVESVVSLETKQPQQQRRERAYPMIALAASFFVAAVSFTLWNTTITHNNNLSVHALSHSAHGKIFVDIDDQVPTLQSVNYRLKDFGNQLTQPLDNLVWFKNCSFEGVDSLHLVFKGKQGRVNVYLIAKGSDFSIEQQFNNKVYHGLAQELSDAYLIIVGDKDEQLQPYQQELSSALISI